MLTRHQQVCSIASVTDSAGGGAGGGVGAQQLPGAANRAMSPSPVGLCTRIRCDPDGLRQIRLVDAADRCNANSTALPGASFWGPGRESRQRDPSPVELGLLSPQIGGCRDRGFTHLGCTLPTLCSSLQPLFAPAGLDLATPLQRPLFRRCALPHLKTRCQGDGLQVARCVCNPLEFGYVAERRRGWRLRPTGILSTPPEGCIADLGVGDPGCEA